MVMFTTQHHTTMALSGEELETLKKALKEIEELWKKGHGGRERLGAAENGVEGGCLVVGDDG